MMPAHTGDNDNDGFFTSQKLTLAAITKNDIPATILYQFGIGTENSK